MMDTLTYSVPGMTCGHCKASIESEVTKVDGVTAVTVDLVAKTVTVTGSGDDGAIRAAIDEAGFDVG